MMEQQQPSSLKAQTAAEAAEFLAIMEQEKRAPSRQSSIAYASSDSPAAPIRYNATKNPKETLNAVYQAGIYKAGLPLNLLCVQSFMAGIYIAMAGHLFLAVGGGVLGSAVFPTGLIAVTLTSAELFTGDALVFVASVLGRRVPLSKLLRNWTVSWCLNFCGCLFWAGAIAYGSDSIKDLGRTELAITVALKKVHQSFLHIFLKAIGANFMVCLGVWQATCAEEVAGKILALWFPIAGFVMLGFEHSIANQFFLPLGAMLGGDIGAGELVAALAAATLGNAIGGGVMVGAVYWYVYDSMAQDKRMFSRIRDGFRINKSRHLRNSTRILEREDRHHEVDEEAP
jgi:formate/nitrite transporter